MKTNQTNPSAARESAPKLPKICISTCAKCGLTHHGFAPQRGDCLRCHGTLIVARWLGTPAIETVASAIRETKSDRTLLPGGVHALAITREKAQGSGYVAGRVYLASCLTSGMTEIVDPMSLRVTYEDGGNYRRFTKLAA